MMMMVVGLVSLQLTTENFPATQHQQNLKIPNDVTDVAEIDHVLLLTHNVSMVKPDTRLSSRETHLGSLPRLTIPAP